MESIYLLDVEVGIVILSQTFQTELRLPLLPQSRCELGELCCSPLFLASARVPSSLPVGKMRPTKPHSDEISESASIPVYHQPKISAFHQESSEAIVGGPSANQTIATIKGTCSAHTTTASLKSLNPIARAIGGITALLRRVRRCSLRGHAMRRISEISPGRKPTSGGSARLAESWRWRPSSRSGHPTDHLLCDSPG